LEDTNGVRTIVISTSEEGGYLRPGEIKVSGTGHAEEDIINYANANGLKVIDIGATSLDNW
jgi:filamentous hemagglutinin